MRSKKRIGDRPPAPPDPGRPASFSFQLASRSWRWPWPRVLGIRRSAREGTWFSEAVEAGFAAWGVRELSETLLLVGCFERGMGTWGASAAEVSVESPASDPFAFTCAFACSAEALSARFETTIFQYSKEIASVQSKMARDEKKGRGGRLSSQLR